MHHTPPVVINSTGIKPVQSLEDGSFVLRVDSQVYSREVIMKACYRLGDKFSTLISSEVENNFSISFLPISSNSNLAVEDAVKLFYAELLDEALRKEIADKTEPIRNLILAQAFSNTSLMANSK